MEYEDRIDASIQAIWLIDENVRILRSLIWLNLIIPLIIREIIIIIVKKLKFKLLFMIKIIGVIFCHVNNNKQLNQFNPSITSGNQKWKGAAPSLVNNAEFNINKNIEFILGVINSVLINIKIIENIKIKEAIVWERKYFKDDSEEYIFFVELNNGIIDNKLISNPIHIPIQEYEEIAINVPIIIVFKNKIL